MEGELSGTADGERGEGHRNEGSGAHRNEQDHVDGSPFEEKKDHRQEAGEGLREGGDTDGGPCLHAAQYLTTGNERAVSTAAEGLVEGGGSILGRNPLQSWRFVALLE